MENEKMQISVNKTKTYTIGLILLLAISAFKVWSYDYEKYKANEFLEKPFSPNQLFEKINKIIKI